MSSSSVTASSGRPSALSSLAALRERVQRLTEALLAFVARWGGQYPQLTTSQRTAAPVSVESHATAPVCTPEGFYAAALPTRIVAFDGVRMTTVPWC